MYHRNFKIGLEFLIGFMIRGYKNGRNGYELDE